MLFKFASYLLGTNNEEEPKPEQQLNVESNENQDTQEQPSTSVNQNNSTSLSRSENLLTNSNEKEVFNIKNKQDLLAEYDDDYMYAEQLINCSKLKNSNFNFESEDLIKEGELGDQLEDDEDYEDDQWIYITPIKRKNEDEKENSDEEFSEQEEEEENFEDEITSKKNLPKKEEADKENERKEKFNFYDYFNNKTIGLTMDEDIDLSSIRSSKPASSLNLSINKLKKINRMEESWIIHPPACFEIDNTFTIEEHPLENALLENPALSIIASCKSLEKENNSSTNSLTNSSLNNTSTANRVLVDRNFNNSQTKAGGKSARKRTNSGRKTNKKQTKKSKKPTKKNDLLVVKSVNHLAAIEPVEQKTNDGNEEQKQVLNERQLLAHYLMNSNQLNTAISTSNTIALSSNGITHPQSTTNHYSHNHTHHHYISNNCVANTQKNASEQKKGSKSLKRNNKVVANRDNLSNRPFTLHRKLC